ncbi:hypothetical protein DYB26_012265, partial [Aphanomyces astaci]
MDLRQRTPSTQAPSSQAPSTEESKSTIIVAPDVVSLVVIFLMSLIAVGTSIYFLILHDLS